MKGHTRDGHGIDHFLKARSVRPSEVTVAGAAGPVIVRAGSAAISGAAVAGTSCSTPIAAAAAGDGIAACRVVLHDVAAAISGAAGMDTTTLRQEAPPREKLRTDERDDRKSHAAMASLLASGPPARTSSRRSGGLLLNGILFLSCVIFASIFGHSVSFFLLCLTSIVFSVAIGHLFIAVLLLSGLAIGLLHSIVLLSLDWGVLLLSGGSL